MFFFHLKNLPGYQWPPLPDSVRCQMWSAYLELDRTQWLDPVEMQRWQLAQVRTLLAHCIAQVPHYREILTSAGIVPRDIQSMEDFRRIPLLRRRTYQEKSESFLAKALPVGTVPTRILQTSGSSGTPTKVYQSNWVNLIWCACYLRDLEWCSIDPTGTIAAIRSTGEHLAKHREGASNRFWLTELDPLIETGPSYVMEIRVDQRRQWQWLREINPDYLMSYPANLEVLANLARQEGSLPALRAIQAISDTLSEPVQSAIETAFGVPVKNTYSCAEAGYLASPCPEGHGLHVHAENVLLEVLDDAGQPCAPGQTGQVFITCLHNLRGPLVRYELGDQVTLGAERCPCGRGLPILARVQGKNSPLFRLKDGRLKNSTSVAFLIRKIGGHWQHQVVQQSLDQFVVRLVKDSTWTEEHAQRLREKMQEYFEAPIRIDLEFPERLELPASGKFQNMVCDVVTPWAAGRGDTREGGTGQDVRRSLP